MAIVDRCWILLTLRHEIPPSISSNRQDPPAFFSADVAVARRFYLDLNPPKGRKLAVVCGGLEHCTADYAIHRASFPFYSIEYVTRGSGELKLKGRTHRLQPGRVFSYGPGVPHDIRGGHRNNRWSSISWISRAEQTPGLLRACGLAAGQVEQVFPPHSFSPHYLTSSSKAA